MNKTNIKYSPNNKLEFVVELRGKVEAYFRDNNLSKYGNGGLVFKTVFMLALYLSPYVLMLTGVISSFIGVLACWIIMGLGKSGVGMAVMHDANHRSYSSNQKVNRWVGNTIYLLGGFPATWQHQHNTLHHGFTNIEGKDEDIDPGAFLRLSPHKPLYKIHKIQHIYAWFLYGLMTLTWISNKDFKQLSRYRKEKAPLSNKDSYNTLLVKLIIAKALYYVAFVVIPLLILPFAWYWIIVFFLAMHFTSGLILTTIFQTAHVVPTSEYPLPNGEGTLENNWAVHQLYTTSDFSPNNKILSWFIGGLNFQVEHHLFPNISHVHYKNLSEMVKQIAHKHNLPYYVQPGFFSATLQHARMLKKLGTSKSI